MSPAIFPTAAFFCAALYASGALGFGLQSVLVAGAVLFAALSLSLSDFVAARLAKLWRRPLGAAAFGFLYVFGMAIAFVLWVMVPPLILLLTAVLGAITLGRRWSPSLLTAIAFGAAIIMLPAIRFEGGLEAIFTAAGGPLAGRLAGAFADGAPIAAFAAALSAVQRPAARVEMALIAVLALAIPPFLYFALVICALYAPRQLHILWLVARGEPGHGRSWLLVLFAVAFLITGFLVFSIGEPDAIMAPAMITFLMIVAACLALPHMVLSLLIQRRTRPAAHEPAPRRAPGGQRLVA